MGLKSLYKKTKKGVKKGIKKVSKAAKSVTKKIDNAADSLNDSVFGDLVDTAVMSVTGVSDVTGKVAKATESIKKQTAFADSVINGIMDMKFKKIKNAAIDLALQEAMSAFQVKQQ